MPSRMTTHPIGLPVTAPIRIRAMTTHSQAKRFCSTMGILSMWVRVAGTLVAPSAPMTMEALLTEASRELRRYSSARSDAEAREAFDALVRCHLPAVGADCPAYGHALQRCIERLMEERSRRRYIPAT